MGRIALGLRSRRSGLALLVALALPALAHAAEMRRDRVFTGLHLFDGRGGPVVPDAVLVVSQGRVAVAGPSRSVEVPSQAERIDLGGRFVFPGFVNAHGHVGETRGLAARPELYDRQNVLAQLRLYATYGVTTVVSLGGDQEPGFRVRDEEAAGPPGRARLRVAGRVVDATTAETARAQVAALQAQKPDWVKIRVDDNLGTSPKMTPEVYRAVIDEAHRRGLRVAAHLFYLEDARGLLDAGADLLAHSVRDREMDTAFISALKERGTCLSPTLVREVSTYVYAEEPSFFTDPFFLKHADSGVLAELRKPERQEAVRKSPAATRYREALAVARRNLKALADAGVPIAFGTDSGPPARFQGYFEHLELDQMVEAGLTPRQALLAATSVAARCVGLAGQVGTLEPGAWADFLVFREDPLVDVRRSRSLESVWIAGERLAPDEGS